MYSGNPDSCPALTGWHIDLNCLSNFAIHLFVQSNQDFRWLVLFDIHTPANFRIRIQEYSRWPNFAPVYLEKYNLERVRERILSMIKIPGYLITTRLDNDDALCRNFVEIVQSNFFGQDFEFLNLQHGYVWHRNRIYLRRLPSNPFISLVERLGL